MQKVDQFTPENFAQKCLLKLNIDELFSGHFLALKTKTARNAICMSSISQLSLPDT